MKSLTQRLAFGLCAALFVVITACAQDPVAYDSPAYFDSPPTMAAQFPQQQLDQLLAPIALYPDSLVAQILAASTYPSEVADAASWMQRNPGLQGAALADAVNAQPWDASVKALTQFPSVLSNLGENRSWTSALGEAYANQPGQVMDELQVLRQRARSAGTLRSTSQQAVTTQGDTIAIQPENPQIVYVPAYDPWLVYGSPILAYPGWVGVPGIYYGGPGLYWGLGLDVGLFAAFGWGWHHWGFDWHNHALMHDHAAWHSHSVGHFGGPGGRFENPGLRGEEHGGFGHEGGFAHEGMPHEGGMAHERGMPHEGGMADEGGGFHGGGFGGGHGGGGHR